METHDNKEYLLELAYKMKEKGLTEEEQAFFDTWYNSYADELLELPEGYAENPIVIRDRILAKLEERITADKAQRTRIRPLWLRITAAASILLFLSAGAYFVFNKKQPSQQVAQLQHDAKPGKDRATLTLANGEKIILIKGLNGKLAQQGNTSIAVNSGSAIAYTTSGQTESVSYNTLSTARGEQSPYPLILADGTKVWLDAASSITYPTVFNGKERVVKITGQAYFEVAHNAVHPFNVAVKDLVIEDIGTQFNINAYDDEPVIRTSLVSGSVRVNRRGTDQQSVVLRPGQDAVAAIRLSVKDGDTEESTAWKNGYFRFNDENIQSIMRQLARWYNIDVEYSGTPPSVGFNAHISRYKNISQVLKVLALTKMVQFQVEGRRVMVKQ